MASRSSHPVGLQISLVRQPLPSLGLADVLAYFLADANNQWRMGLNDTDFGGRVYFTHKGCCQAFEDAHPEDGFVWGAMELSCLPIYLGNGLALDWEGARRSAETLGSIE